MFSRTDMIGQGAYGIVYKGVKQDTGETVAIKRIPFADSTPEGGVPCNVIREISLLRELDHTNVVKLLDIIQASSGGLYLVFEYVTHDLKTYMDQFQTSDDITERVGLNVQTIRSFLRQIIAGVGCCHTYRILHRDLKPHNVSSTSWNTDTVLCYLQKWRRNVCILHVVLVYSILCTARTVLLFKRVQTAALCMALCLHPSTFRVHECL